MKTNTNTKDASNKLKLVFIPGLGYDSRIFKRLDLTEYPATFLKWIEPLPNEHITDYACRMFKDQDYQDYNVVLIGHSFGGIIAQEIALQYPIKAIILVSSVQKANEIPKWLKLIAKLSLQNILNKEFSIRTIKYWGHSHGFTEKADITLFKSMVTEHSNKYLRWALRALGSWSPKQKPSTLKIYQIHGTNDKTFPIRQLNNVDITLTHGSHIFIYKRPKESTEHLRTLLQSINR